MTKKYCDHCNVEVINREFITLTFDSGSIGNYEWKNIHLCEKCFKIVSKQISKFIKIETTA